MEMAFPELTELQLLSESDTYLSLLIATCHTVLYLPQAPASIALGCHQF
jgi:hypothetical protein